MIATNYSEVRNNLKTYCDKATKDYETIIITRKNNENVVLMSEEEYNNLMENLYELCQNTRDSSTHRVLVVRGSEQKINWL
ncbi:type II toxin-antitoxin system Phd/YefM family antitoxin [Fusobacterium animalis]|uniref:type II toxin-antitoxin system Phd/YefM family antitoxin n=1 Tax=Fusobacterium animalis TaxID=76859 RepID=UPI0034DEC450